MVTHTLKDLPADLPTLLPTGPRNRPWENLNPADFPPPPPSSRPATREPKSYSPSGPLSDANVAARQFSSIGLIILLYTAAMPFEPFAWCLGRVSGTYFFDRLLAGILLFCAFYFQWRIASLRGAVIISLPTPGGGTSIRNGRVERDSGGGSTPIWVWRTGEYWHFALCEAALLVLAEWGPSEMLRRTLISGVIAFLWLVGFAATPESYKRWAWAHIKAYLFVLVFDELRRVAWSAVGSNSNGRRARQARW